MKDENCILSIKADFAFAMLPRLWYNDNRKRL